MRFLNFFKKLTAKKEEPKIEKISLNNLENWIKNRQQQNKEKEKEILNSINEKTKETIKDLNEKLKIIKNININEKQEQNKVKAIVNENFNNYIAHLKNFIENIDLKEDNLEKYITKINKVFLDFDKKSYTSYQKAAFLVGKELADVKNTIFGFSRYLTKTLDENKNFIDNSRTISFIGLKLDQINKSNEIIDNINERIISLNLKITNNKEINNNFLKDIENAKKSEDYLKNLKKQHEVTSIEKELEKEIYNLKEIINLKNLANFFHNHEKEMSIIKFHKEDFQSAFQKDNGMSISNLLDTAKLNNERISNKIKYINDKKEIIKNFNFKDEAKDLLFKINKINSDISNLEDEKIKEIKKIDKLKINKEEIINSLKSELEKLNAVIE